MHTRGKKLHKGLVDTYGGFIKDIEGKLKSGIPTDDCLAKTLIQLRHEENLDDLDMAIMASAFLIGGVETVSLPAYALTLSRFCTDAYAPQTAAIMQWFSALIPAYPEIQKKAQAELDHVVGRNRLPTIEDEKNLPYCHAIIKEVSDGVFLRFALGQV
jgi:hypothetical protein